MSSNSTRQVKESESVCNDNGSRRVIDDSKGGELSKSKSETESGGEEDKPKLWTSTMSEEEETKRLIVSVNDKKMSPETSTK